MVKGRAFGMNNVRTAASGHSYKPCLSGRLERKIPSQKREQQPRRVTWQPFPPATISAPVPHMEHWSIIITNIILAFSFKTILLLQTTRRRLRSFLVVHAGLQICSLQYDYASTRSERRWPTRKYELRITQYGSCYVHIHPHLHQHHDCLSPPSLITRIAECDEPLADTYLRQMLQWIYQTHLPHRGQENNVKRTREKYVSWHLYTRQNSTDEVLTTLKVVRIFTINYPSFMKAKATVLR